MKMYISLSLNCTEYYVLGLHAIIISLLVMLLLLNAFTYVFDL